MEKDTTHPKKFTSHQIIYIYYYPKIILFHPMATCFLSLSHGHFFPLSIPWPLVSSLHPMATSFLSPSHGHLFFLSIPWPLVSSLHSLTCSFMRSCPPPWRCPSARCGHVLVPALLLHSTRSGLCPAVV